jgi:heme-degrading monooxygenase HmoA
MVVWSFRMLVTVFRSRLNPGVQDEYGVWAARMSELASTMPGYISHKGFTAPDGERVTIVEFETEDAQRVWSSHAEHLQAKRLGRDSFYSEYKIQVCRVEREHLFPRK